MFSWMWSVLMYRSVNVKAQTHRMRQDHKREMKHRLYRWRRWREEWSGQPLVFINKSLKFPPTRLITTRSDCQHLSMLSVTHTYGLTICHRKHERVFLHVSDYCLLPVCKHRQHTMTERERERETVRQTDRTTGRTRDGTTDGKNR